MINKIYKGIRLALSTSVPALKRVLWSNGEYDDQDQNEAWETPSAYIEFEDVYPKSNTNGIQSASVAFAVVLHTSDLKNPDSDSHLEHLDLMQDIYKALQGLSIKEGDQTVCNAIERTGIKTDHAQTQGTITRQSFKTFAFDYAAQPTRTLVMATPQIDVSYGS